MSASSIPVGVSSQATAPIRNLARLTAAMLDSGRYSDLTIKCHGTVFNVHRNIVCLQSKPLAAAVDVGFKEGLTGVINLDDDEAEIITKLVHFFYGQDYSDGRPTTFAVRSVYQEATKGRFAVSTPPHAPQAANMATTTGALLSNAKFYIAADKYDIPALKDLSKSKYQSAVFEGWKDGSFAASLKLLYENTLEGDRMLKDVAVKAGAKNVSQIIGRGEFAQILKANGEIAYDVLKATLVAEAHITASHLP